MIKNRQLSAAASKTAKFVRNAAFLGILAATLFTAGRLGAQSYPSSYSSSSYPTYADLRSYGMSVCDDYGNCATDPKTTTTLIAGNLTYSGYVYNDSSHDIGTYFTNSFWGAPLGLQFFPFLEEVSLGLSARSAAHVVKHNPGGTGKFSFKLCADKSTDTDRTGNIPRSNSVPETDESHNCSESVSVEIIAPPRISASIVGQSALVSGESATFSVLSGEQGEFSYSGQTCGAGALVSASGNSFTCRFSTSGVYTIGAAISQWKVPTSVSKTVSVSAPAVPNLAASLDKVCDSYGQCGDNLYAGTLSFTATVRNSGSGPAGASTLGFLRAGSRSPLVSSNAPALSAGGADGAAKLTAAADNMPAGSYQFFVCADSGGVIAESNESDNCSVPQSITVVDKPTLLASLSASPSGVVTAPASIKWNIVPGGTAVGAMTYSNPNCGDGQRTAVQSDGSFSCHYENAGSYRATLTVGRQGLSVSAAGSIIISPQSYQLSVSKTGSGSGAVSGSGISCGSACSASFTQGTSVTLTAAPASGSAVNDWEGCDSISDNGASCTVAVTSARTVSAAFSLPASAPPFLITAIPSASVFTNQEVWFKVTYNELYDGLDRERNKGLFSLVWNPAVQQNQKQYVMEPHCGNDTYAISSAYESPTSEQHSDFFLFGCIYPDSGTYKVTITTPVYGSSGKLSRFRVGAETTVSVSPSPGVGVASPIPEGARFYDVPGQYSWTAPAGVTKAHVFVWGDGGAGYFAAGGGGGGFAEGIVPVSPGTTYDVIVAKGGDPTYWSGSRGSDSRFGNFITAYGGNSAGLTGAPLPNCSSDESLCDTPPISASTGGGAQVQREVTDTHIYQGQPGEWHFVTPPGFGGYSKAHYAVGAGGAGGGGGGAGGTPDSVKGVAPGGGGGYPGRRYPTSVGGYGAPGRVIIAPVVSPPSITLSAATSPDCGGKINLSWNLITVGTSIPPHYPPSNKNGLTVSSKHVITRWLQDPLLISNPNQAPDKTIIVEMGQNSFQDVVSQPDTAYWYRIETSRAYTPASVSGGTRKQGWLAYNAFGSYPSVTDFWDTNSAVSSPACPTPPDLKATIDNVTGNKPPYIPVNPYVKDSAHKDGDGAYHFYIGSPLTITGTITNQGKTEVRTPFTTALRESNADISGSGISTPSLGPNNMTAPYSYTKLSLSQGSHSVQLCADTGNSVPEDNKGNNCSDPVTIVMEPIRVPKVKLYIAPANASCGTLHSATILKGAPVKLCWDASLLLLP